MGWLHLPRLNIRNRIFVGSALLFLPFIVLAAMTGVMTQRIDGVTASLRTESVPGLSALESLRMEGLRVIETTNTFALINLVGRHERQPFKAFSRDKEAEMLKARDNFTRALATLRRLNEETGRADASTNNIAFAHDEILQHSERIADKANTNVAAATILQLRERFDSSAANFRNLIQVAIDAEHAELVRRQVDLGGQTRAVVLIVVTLTVLGTFTALLGGYQLSSRIARPIRMLRDATIRLAGGDFESMPAWSTNDEVGELVDAFGGMARHLKRNIAERETAQHAAERSEQRLLKAQRVAQIGSWEWIAETNRLRWSPEALRIFGYDTDVTDLPIGDWKRSIHPEDVGPTMATLDANRDRGLAFDMRYRILRADGSIRMIHERVEPVLDGSGAIVGETGTLQDMTELRNLEEQLHQAQRMQAVGQLTGGIAHDFNNLLAVILGNLELIQELDNLEPAARQRIDTAVRNTLRGAELTHRLLAFSRRQPLSPKATNINELIRSLQELICRPLGPKIEFDVVESSTLWLTEVDQAQLENALLNLVLNARDAMPQGGTLTIETRNVVINHSDISAGQDLAPGGYVAVTVRDTGCGMPPAVAARAFEPFFTTKDVGKGTGLGLSMVYGFVKQSGGHVRLWSEQGHGTTVQLLLPQLRSESDAESSAMVEARPGRGEKILVVDDEADLRELARSYLESSGYEVFTAANGSEALAALNRLKQIDLLLTDIILPGNLDGRATARRARILRPGLKVLFMSGHAPQVTADSGQIDEPDLLIPKPFRKSELSRKLREVLDAAPPNWIDMRQRAAG